MKRNGLPFVDREFCHCQLSSRSIGPKVVPYDTKAGANQQQFVGLTVTQVVSLYCYTSSSQRTQGQLVLDWIDQ